MAVLSAMQSAALRLIGRKPTTFFGATGQFEAEICDWVNEVAQDIARYQDWQILQRVTTLTGDGSTTEFSLPVDYDRMLQNASVQDLRNWVWGYFGFTNINSYLFEKARGFTPYPGGWIIYGGKMHFSPAPMSSGATFPYITNHIVTANDATPKTAFTADTDSFVLPERLITLALVWRWRENKKLDASGDQEAFIKAMDEYAAKDKGAQIQRFGTRRRFPNTSIAYHGIG